jgi:hypothetical protein
MSYILFVENDNLLQLIGLIDQSSGAFLNAATVEGNILDRSGVVVVGPITMTYVANSNGNYQGVVPSTAGLTVSHGYRAKVVATQSGATGTWFLPVTIKYREY